MNTHILPWFLLAFLCSSFSSFPVLAQNAEYEVPQPVTYAYFDWGNPLLTEGDLYSYARPDWVLFSYKFGGNWTAAPTGWHVGADAPENEGNLVVELNREVLAADACVRYIVRYYDSPDSSLYIDLLDTNTVAILTNAVGNLLSGSGEVVERDFELPIASNPDAWIIALRRGTGEALVLESLVYLGSPDELSGRALMDGAISALNEISAAADASDAADGESAADAEAAAKAKDEAEAAEREREREHRVAAVPDSQGFVNLRVFTMME